MVCLGGIKAINFASFQPENFVCANFFSSSTQASPSLFPHIIVLRRKKTVVTNDGDKNLHRIACHEEENEIKNEEEKGGRRENIHVIVDFLMNFHVHHQEFLLML